MLIDTKTLCDTYSPLSPQERLARLFEDFDRVLITSSFGATSVILLHMLRRIKPDYPVHFIDTSYHFPETLAFRDKMMKEWGLNIVSVNPSKIENRHTQLDWTWAYAPDLCCAVNKVLPLNRLKESHDVWISGMVGGNTHRSSMPIFKDDPRIMRFYPMIDMTEEDAEMYKWINELPQHPLETQGYASIGCHHCTKPGKGREGRWVGKQKTECGLHVLK